MGCVNSKVKKQEPETISISDLLHELSKFDKRKRYYLKRKSNYSPKKSKTSPSHCCDVRDDEKRHACAEESVAVPSSQEPSNEITVSEPIVDDNAIEHNESTEERSVFAEESVAVPSPQEPSNEVSVSEPIVDDNAIKHNKSTEERSVCAEESVAVPSPQEPSRQSESIVDDNTIEHNESTVEGFQHENDAVSLAVAVSTFPSNPLNDVIPSLQGFSVPSLVQTSLPGFDYLGGFDINQLFNAEDCLETVGAPSAETNQGEWMSVLESLHMHKMYDPSVDYDMITEIGEGSFGHVYLAKHKQIQEEFAIKTIPLGNTENQANIVNELEILRLSLHKNIVFLAESFLYDHSVYIVTEYIDGLTISTICQMATFSELTIASITKECLQGLEYLHERCYVHCDIKGSNILLSKDGKVKLVDFGLAIKTDSTTNAGIRGTFLWRAPEISSERPYGNKVDIWSLGMVVVEMLQQHPPLYWIEDVQQILALSRSGYTELQEHVRHMVSEDLLDFLYRGALVVDPNERLSAQQLVQHPFMMCGDNGECLPGIVEWALQQQLLQ